MSLDKQSDSQVDDEPRPWQRSAFSVCVQRFCVRSNRTDIRRREVESSGMNRTKLRFSTLDLEWPLNSRTTNSIGFVSLVSCICQLDCSNELWVDRSIRRLTRWTNLPKTIDSTNEFWILVRFDEQRYHHIHKSTKLVPFAKGKNSWSAIGRTARLTWTLLKSTLFKSANIWVTCVELSRTARAAWAKWFSDV